MRQLKTSKIAAKNQYLIDRCSSRTRKWVATTVLHLVAEIKKKKKSLRIFHSFGSNTTRTSIHPLEEIFPFIFLRFSQQSNTIIWLKLRFSIFFYFPGVFFFSQRSVRSYENELKPINLKLTRSPAKAPRMTKVA